MGTIHQLNARSRVSPSAAVPPAAEACEIVIFPGVRIERHDDAALADPHEYDGYDETGGGRRPRKSS